MLIAKEHWGLTPNYGQIKADLLREPAPLKKTLVIYTSAYNMAVIWKYSVSITDTNSKWILD